MDLEKHCVSARPLQILTAALWRKLPQVQLFEGEVYVGGKFVRSGVGVGKTFEVWGDVKDRKRLFRWVFLMWTQPPARAMRAEIMAKTNTKRSLLILFRCLRKDTDHEDLRELLDAERFGAFLPGFAFVARLRESHRGSESLVMGNSHIIFTKSADWLHQASYRSLISVQHVFLGKES